MQNSLEILIVFVASIFIDYLDSMDYIALPPDQKLVTVEFDTSAKTHLLSSILPKIGLGRSDCNLNSVCYPLRTSRDYTTAPAIMDFKPFLAPWDTRLTKDHKLWLMITDLSLYKTVLEFADEADCSVCLCSAAVPRTRCEETVVVVAYLPLTDFVDTVSRHCEAMQLQIQGLESKLERQATILDRLRHWVCAQDPNLVPLLGQGPMLANMSGSPF